MSKFQDLEHYVVGKIYELMQQGKRATTVHLTREDEHTLGLLKMDDVSDYTVSNIVLNGPRHVFRTFQGLDVVWDATERRVE